MGTFANISSIFSDIADSLRSKMGTQDTFLPSDMAGAVNNIPTGGGAIEITTGRLIYDFNMPVSISDGVTNMAFCFSSCSNFNQPVNIPNSVTNMQSCFFGCSIFNQPINIPDGVTSMANCFPMCFLFNQPVNIPNSVTNMQNCFRGSNNFNQPVIIGKSVKDMVNCFSSTKFNQSITIPDTVTNVAGCFAVCMTFNKKNVYFERSSLIQNAYRMFGGMYNYQTKYIRCNDATPFIETVASKSITGDAMTWTALSDGNGYKNTAYNIYIYNNWSPS